MKILFLSHTFYPQVGGIEANTEVLAGAFTDAGHEVHLLTWSGDSTGKEFPYTVIRNPTRKKLLQEHQWASLVFENNPCFRLGWPGLFFGRPAVIAINTWISRADGKISLRDKIKIHWWLKRCKEVIAVSDAIRRVCWPAATVIVNPYRVNDFKIIPEVVRNADFVFLGRLVSDKGADQAIRAMHTLKNTIDRNNKRSTACLTIIGDGPDRLKLESLVSELSLTDQVIFTGALRGEQLSRSLNRHRFLLVPSAWEEPFGNVVLEGMACGCVPIASDGGGLPEAVGNAGLTFRRNDIESFVTCIRRLLNDPKLERQLREAAPAHLAAHHPRLVARKYLQVIQKAFR
ncbi:MAG: glycosyltransferase family 4 protein [Bacteroidota bacterium]